MTETPFRIAISDQDIDDLKKRLDLTRFPDELEDVGRDYGAPLRDIQRLVAYWKDGYDWRKHEAQLNDELPQFTRDIEVEGFGLLNVHYVHKKSSVASAVPLLFVHGCKCYSPLFIRYLSLMCRVQGPVVSMKSGRYYLC